uniref:PAS domain-containing protein n=1 Tax=Sphaeramia orbicularis TaxID=375764 RepID=A0A673BQP7_9TELE
MAGGDSGLDGEEAALPAATADGGGLVRPQDEGEQSERLRGEEGTASGGEVGQEDEEMTSGSHELSSSANHSPGSATGSTSASTKSSEQANGGKGQTHREVMITVAEMKKRLPSDKRSRSKASTVEALHYALNCVKQVQANSEYYKLLMRNGQDERRDATVCTLEELERVTSEHTLKNTDSFVVVFSLSSCRVLYASEQAPSILCCKRKFLESAKFVELLYHQDVNVFYSHTAQPHLPPWSNSHSVGVLFDCAQVKSFFCRIRSVGGKDREGEMRYNPFRITPYLLKVQGTGSGGEEEEPCCLALAERIISGYEAPRIPMDKRIFTTTHSPGCVFLEVDDRAVPLLGYLPQDLIGTSLLTCIHPDDRPLMLSMHRKVLKYAGQPPFEHSPVRLRCQNGDYITLDTSWSSFINPWSRKVAFIIGRHKIFFFCFSFTVFLFMTCVSLCAQQPVHNNGSSGYGSLGSNGSHEHYISVASSSDSNGNLWEDSHRGPMTLQQICADVNRVKTWGQQAYLDSTHKIAVLGKPATGMSSETLELFCIHKRANIVHIICAKITLYSPTAHRLPAASNPEVRDHEEGRKQTHIPSYQQINCVDNIIRYLESCTGPVLKRKSESHSLATSSSSSSTSEDDKPPGATDTAQTSSDGINIPVVGAPLTDLTMSTKAMSVVSVTSQCSYSSTIVHVPQPESGIEPTDATATPARPAPSPATEERRFVGLTKEVLSAHTQKEEQEYVDRFRHRILQSPYSSYLQLDNSSMAHSHHPGMYLLINITNIICVGQFLQPLFISLQATTFGDAPSDSGNHDAQSTSSELLDLLLQEDARSGTGSNASGSGSGESGGSLGSGSGSGSNGTSTSHTGSSNSSKYFASNDSSDTSRKARKSQEPPAEHSFETQVENSLWSMIQHTPERVMMTYQIRTRDQNEVLAEDREKLRVLQPLQPWFTQEQREELAEVHPWIQQHTIPQEIDTQVGISTHAPHTIHTPVNETFVTHLCVPQGCVSCSAGAGVAHSPHPQLPDSSSPLESPQPDSIGPAVDT